MSLFSSQPAGHFRGCRWGPRLQGGWPSCGIAPCPSSNSRALGAGKGPPSFAGAADTEAERGWAWGAVTPAPHPTPPAALLLPGRCTTCSTAQLGTGSRWPQLPPPKQPCSLLCPHSHQLALGQCPVPAPLLGFPALRYESTPRVTEQGKRVLQGPWALGRAYSWTHIDSGWTESLRAAPFRGTK